MTEQLPTPDSTPQIESPELKWIRENEPILREQYKGRWIAVVGTEIVASAKTSDEVLEKAFIKSAGTPHIHRFASDNDPIVFVPFAGISSSKTA